MNAGYQVGRVVGNVATGAVALGVGATLGAARSFVDASSSAFQRVPPASRPLPPPPMRSLPGASADPQAQSQQSGGVLSAFEQRLEAARGSYDQSFPQRGTPARASQPSAGGRGSSPGQQTEVKEEPNGSDGSKMGLQEVEVSDGESDEDVHQSLSEVPHLRRHVDRLKAKLLHWRDSSRAAHVELGEKQGELQFFHREHRALLAVMDGFYRDVVAMLGRHGLTIDELDVDEARRERLKQASPTDPWAAAALRAQQQQARDFGSREQPGPQGGPRQGHMSVLHGAEGARTPPDFLSKG